MFNTDKSLSILVIGFCLLVLIVFISPIFADEDYGNVLPDANAMMEMSVSQSMSLPFDPNSYRFLIYVPNPDGQEDSIRAAMKIILGRDLTPSEIRTSSNPVTANDLTTHDILIVGWNAGGNTTGLHSDDLLAGITGRVILSGHDLDFHTVHGIEAAQTMLIQSINYILQGGGTGMITLGDGVDAFSYLPKQDWGIGAVTGGTNYITEFTQQGLGSGIFDGLEPNKMCYWNQSYHDVFNFGQVSNFVPFELGGYDGNDIVTIARTMGILGLLPIIDIPEGNCVLPGQYINYTITYTADRNDTNVAITDFLSDEIDYNSSTPAGIYDDINRTITWGVGNVSKGDSNTYSISVRVNNLAEPLGEILNIFRIQGDHTRNDITCRTPVCCWNPGVIFVDDTDTGSNTGMS